MYEIIYSKESVNFLEQLSKSKSKKIVDVIDKTGLYPMLFLNRFAGVLITGLS